MINSFRIDNFKSLVDFQLDLSGFTCLIGLNGAGKSTVLQALDFTSAIIDGGVTDWLAKRSWKAKDLDSNLVNRKIIKVEIALSIEEQHYYWSATFNYNKLSCTEERLVRLDPINSYRLIDLFSVVKGRYSLHDEPATPSTFNTKVQPYLS